MKFQNSNIHNSKVSNFTEKWKNQSKFQNSVLLSKFDKKFSKVNQVINSSAPTSIPNMKVLVQILFEIYCTQDFQILFSKGHNSEKGHNLDMKNIWVNYFFIRNLYMKFQNSSNNRSKVSNVKEKWKNQSKFKNSVFFFFFFFFFCFFFFCFFLSKFDGKFSKVNQVISSALTSISNMKALASILFEISCTQDFQFFSKGNNSEKGHDSDKKKIRVIYSFHEEYTHEILKL